MSEKFSSGQSPIDFDHRYQSPLYTEDHRAWRDSLRKFIEAEIMPHVNEWDEAGEFPRSLYKKAAAVGLIGMGYPAEYGGTPVSDPMYSIVTAEEMARMGAGGYLPPFLGVRKIIVDLFFQFLASPERYDFAFRLEKIRESGLPVGNLKSSAAGSFKERAVDALNFGELHGVENDPG